MDKQRRQIWWPPPQSSSHNSHRSRGWIEEHTHGHKHRQTDRRAHGPPRGLSQCPGAWSWLLPVHPGVSLPSLGAHNLAGPRLVGSVWGQLGEHHLHGLELLVLGRNGAHLVGHLVTLHWNVLPFDVRYVHKDVL